MVENVTKDEKLIKINYKNEKEFHCSFVNLFVILIALQILYWFKVKLSHKISSKVSIKLDSKQLYFVTFLGKKFDIMVESGFENPQIDSLPKMKPQKSLQGLLSQVQNFLTV